MFEDYIIITGAIEAQYFGLSRSFDRGTELKSGFVAEVIPSVSGFVIAVVAAASVAVDISGRR